MVQGTSRTPRRMHCAANCSCVASVTCKTQAKARQTWQRTHGCASAAHVVLHTPARTAAPRHDGSILHLVPAMYYATRSHGCLQRAPGPSQIREQRVLPPRMAEPTCDTATRSSSATSTRDFFVGNCLVVIIPILIIGNGGDLTRSVCVRAFARDLRVCEVGRADMINAQRDMTVVVVTVNRYTRTGG